MTRILVSQRRSFLLLLLPMALLLARTTLERRGSRVLILNDSRQEPGGQRTAAPVVPLDWLQNLQADLNNRLVQMAALRD